MAQAKLHTSADFFKQISLDFQQLKLIIQILETCTLCAAIRGNEVKDKRLVLILNQMGTFIAIVQELLDSLERESLEALLLVIVVAD